MTECDGCGRVPASDIGALRTVGRQELCIVCRDWLKEKNRPRELAQTGLGEYNE